MTDEELLMDFRTRFPVSQPIRFLKPPKADTTMWLRLVLRVLDYACIINNENEKISLIDGGYWGGLWQRGKGYTFGAAHKRGWQHVVSKLKKAGLVR